MIQTKLALFAENAQLIKKDFTWHNVMTKRLAALLYALDGRRIDCAAIRDCHAFIKNSTGVFSEFRGNMAIAVAALLSLSGDRDGQLADTLAVYDMLKAAKLRRSDFLAIAAYQIASHSEPDSYKETVARTRAFYDGMKANHFLLTAQDDYIFAAMLGLSGIEVKEGTARIERLYQRLKPEFWANKPVQDLAQVLTLGGKSESAAERVLILRDAFKESKLRMDRAYTLPLLGVLSLLPAGTDALVRDVAAAQDYLRSQKGFSSFSIDVQQLLLCSSAIVASTYAEGLNDDLLTASLTTSIANIIIAQEAAMIAAAATASAAASSN